MVYGYARISTKEVEGKQCLNSQFQELKKMGCEVIMYDMESGLNDERKELNKLLEIVKEKDYIICVEPSRITRSISGLIKILKIAEEKRIGIKLGSLEVDFSKDKVDPISIAIMKLITIFSEMEAELIRYRVKRGLMYTDKKLGRPTTTYDKIPQIFFYYLPMYESGTINKSEYSRLTNLSYPSIYKYLEVVKRHGKK